MPPRLESATFAALCWWSETASAAIIQASSRPMIHARRWYFTARYATAIRGRGGLGRRRRRGPSPGSLFRSCIQPRVFSRVGGCTARVPLRVPLRGVPAPCLLRRRSSAPSWRALGQLNLAPAFARSRVSSAFCFRRRSLPGASCGCRRSAARPAALSVVPAARHSLLMRTVVTSGSSAVDAACSSAGPYQSASAAARVSDSVSGGRSCGAPCRRSRR